MELNLQKITDFVESLNEKDFHHYLSPTSYYNTNLENSICDKSLLSIPIRKLLNLYFFLLRNEEEIIQMVFEKLYDLEEDDEVEMNGLNWYVIIYLMLDFDYKKLYDNLYSEVDRNLLNILNTNKNFNRDQYFIINDLESETTYYCEKLSHCYSYLIDTDRRVDAEELLRDKSYHRYDITLEKGDLILFKLKMYIPKMEDAHFMSLERHLKIRNIFRRNESIIIRFDQF